MRTNIENMEIGKNAELMETRRNTKSVNKTVKTIC